MGSISKLLPLSLVAFFVGCPSGSETSPCDYPTRPPTCEHWTAIAERADLDTGVVVYDEYSTSERTSTDCPEDRCEFVPGGYYHFSIDELPPDSASLETLAQDEYANRTAGLQIVGRGTYGVGLEPGNHLLCSPMVLEDQLPTEEWGACVAFSLVQGEIGAFYTHLDDDIERLETTEGQQARAEVVLLRVAD